MKTYKFDATTKTLTISAAFDKEMQNPDSEEYALYMKLSADIPNLTVCRKTHKTPTSYKTKSGDKLKHNPYKNLTTDRMKKFIASMPNSDKYMEQYNKIESFACISGNSYHMVAKWFVEQFPEYRVNPLTYVFTSPILLTAEAFVEAEKKVA